MRHELRSIVRAGVQGVPVERTKSIGMFQLVFEGSMNSI